jgi:hypothetical protein
MRCDSRASFLARTLASPYLGPEPKVKVATPYLQIVEYTVKGSMLFKPSCIRTDNFET